MRIEDSYPIKILTFPNTNQMTLIAQPGVKRAREFRRLIIEAEPLNTLFDCPL